VVGSRPSSCLIKNQKVVASAPDMIKIIPQGKMFLKSSETMNTF
jgi:hypothetical protein